MRIAAAVLVAAGTFASILTIAAELLRWRMSESPRRTRIAVAVALLIASFLLGIATLRMEQPSPQPATVSRPPIIVVAAREEPTITAPKPAMVAKAEPSRQAGPRSQITLGERERSMPEVVAAADDVLTILGSELPTIRGNLRATQSGPDMALQGLITTDLTLDLRLMNDTGVVVDAFTITSRGGGFTADASGLQARVRLLDALRKRIGKE